MTLQDVFQNSILGFVTFFWTYGLIRKRERSLVKDVYCVSTYIKCQS